MDDICNNGEHCVDGVNTVSMETVHMMSLLVASFVTATAFLCAAWWNRFWAFSFLLPAFAKFDDFLSNIYFDINSTSLIYFDKSNLPLIRMSSYPSTLALSSIHLRRKSRAVKTFQDASKSVCQFMASSLAGSKLRSL